MGNTSLKAWTTGTSPWIPVGILWPSVLGIARLILNFGVLRYKNRSANIPRIIICSHDTKLHIFPRSLQLQISYRALVQHFWLSSGCSSFMTSPILNRLATLILSLMPHHQAHSQTMNTVVAEASSVGIYIYIYIYIYIGTFIKVYYMC